MTETSQTKQLVRTTTAPAIAEPTRSRWPLIWAVGVFQLKLLVEGLKDIALFPLSMVAAGIDLLAGNSPERGLFATVLRAGRGFENWVNLFAAIETEQQRKSSLDAHLDQVEQVLRDQAKREDLTARARTAVDDALKAIARAQQQQGDAKSD